MTRPTTRSEYRPIKIVDVGNYSSFNTTFGESIVAQRFTEILEEFQYTINTKTLTDGSENNATVTQSDSMAILTSSTTSNGHAQLESKKKLRYRPGHEGYAFFTSLWANGGVANSKQYCGLFDDGDGFFLGYNGTDFVVGYRKNTTDTTVTKSNFNGDSSFDSIDTSKLNIFMITYAWLGTAPINFWWMNERGEWVLIHRFELPNTLTGPSVTNPVLPLRFDITKTSGDTSIVMKTASWHAGIAHDGDTQGDRYFTGSITKNTVSTESVLINFQNVSTFQSKTNKVRVYATLLGAAGDGTKTGEIKIYKNLAIGGTPSWSNVDATNSVMQKDTAGTVTPSDANLLISIPLGRNDSKQVDVTNQSFFLDPGSG